MLILVGQTHETGFTPRPYLYVELFRLSTAPTKWLLRSSGKARPSICLRVPQVVRRRHPPSLHGTMLSVEVMVRDETQSKHKADSPSKATVQSYAGELKYVEMRIPRVTSSGSATRSVPSPRMRHQYCFPQGGSRVRSASRGGMLMNRNCSAGRMVATSGIKFRRLSHSSGLLRHPSGPRAAQCSSRQTTLDPTSIGTV